MSGYYEDPDKITFDEAERLVDRYIREYSDRRSRVCSTHVAETYDVESEHHNLIRISDALNDRLEVRKVSSGRGKEYRL